MSKKHFIAIARALRENKADPKLVDAIADVCATTNSQFDRVRFLYAATHPDTISDAAGKAGK